MFMWLPFKLYRGNNDVFLDEVVNFYFITFNLRDTIILTTPSVSNISGIVTRNTS